MITAFDVVKESNGDERIICVFRSSDGRALQSQRPDKPAAEIFIKLPTLANDTIMQVIELEREQARPFPISQHLHRATLRRMSPLNDTCELAAAVQHHRAARDRRSECHDHARVARR